jgi:hypothetical protein
MRYCRVVYFCRSDDAIKIGCTGNLKRRLKQISCDIEREPELLGFVFGTFATEKLIHNSLSAFSEGEEWFRDCLEVRALIDFLLERGPHFYGLPPRNSPPHNIERKPGCGPWRVS